MSDKTARTVLKKPSSLDVLFACNFKRRNRSDPFVPDVPITSLWAARRARNMPSATWDEVTTQLDSPPPPHGCVPFPWIDTLATLKLDRVTGFLCRPRGPIFNSVDLRRSIPPVHDVMTESYSQATSDKRKRHAVQDPPPLVQCATYGVEKLACGTAVGHGINLIIFDQVVWIWWYDREGAIQSSGIGLITNMPRFLFLLITFQRFTLGDWRFIPEHHPLVDDAHCSSDALRSCEGPFAIDYWSGIKIEVSPNDLVYKRERLVGRGSRVITGESRSTVDGQSLSGIPLVAKFSWIDSSLIPEAALVQRALDRGAGNKALTDHMPRIFASRTFDYSTATIRQVLEIPRRTRRVMHDGKDIEVEANHSRVLRSLVCERLNPIENLQSAEFLKAFFQIQRCHYEAWNVGIHHNDPSLANFMYRVGGEEKFSVLNDWDLATDVLAEHINSSFERTGTLPFMAMDLLEQGVGVHHLYRHNLEAITGILIWVVTCYDNGHRRVPPSMQAWLAGDCESLYMEKLAFYDQPRKWAPSPSWKAEWPLVLALVDSLAQQRFEDRRSLEKYRVKDPKEVARLHWEVIEGSGIAFPLKDDVSKPLL